jgi:hypothetical protein
MRFSNRVYVVVTSLALAALNLGCSTPLANRTARAVPVGQVEVSGSADLFGAVLTAGPTSGTALPLPPILPNLEASGRFGVAKNLDVQLRLDTYVYIQRSPSAINSSVTS